MSAAMSLLAPVGLAFWWCMYRWDNLLEADHPVQEAFRLLLLISCIGFVPFLISWAVGLLPFAVRGKEHPRVWKIHALASATAGVGACWGIGFAYFDMGWIWIPGMAMSGIGPGLGYGLWLRGKLRAAAEAQAQIESGPTS